MANLHVTTAKVGADPSASTVVLPAFNLAAGNLVAVAVSNSSDNQSVLSIADSAGNTYALATGSKIQDATTGTFEWHYAKNALPHAANVITITYTAAVTFRYASALQYSGPDTVSPFEAAAFGTSELSPVTSAAFSPAGAGNLNVVATIVNTGVAWDPAANYVLRGAGSDPQGTADRLDAPAGSQTASMISDSNGHHLIVVASFKPPGAGGNVALAMPIGSLVASAATVPTYIVNSGQIVIRPV